MLIVDAGPLYASAAATSVACETEALACAPVAEPPPPLPPVAAKAPPVTAKTSATTAIAVDGVKCLRMR